MSTTTPPLRSRGEFAIVEIVAIERNQRAAQLSREAIVLAITRAPQIVVLDDEEHVPRERCAHERHEARGHVRIDVDARLSGQLLGVAAELGRQRAHLVACPCHMYSAFLAGHPVPRRCSSVTDSPVCSTRRALRPRRRAAESAAHMTRTGHYPCASLACCFSAATSSSRVCTRSLRGRRPFGEPTTYSQNSGKPIVEST